MNVCFVLQFHFVEYSPNNYTAPAVLQKPVWADPDILHMYVCTHSHMLHWVIFEQPFNIHIELLRVSKTY